MTNSPVFLISELRVLPRQWRKAQGRKQNETDQLQLRLKLEVAKGQWKIPWTEEPGRLQSMGSLRVRHN